MFKKVKTTWALFLSSVGVALAEAEETETMGGLCSILGKIHDFAPVAVKVFAFIILVVGFGSGGFMIIDRERNMMGRGVIVIALALVIFSLLWVIASPLQEVIATGKSALGCGS